MFNRALSLAVVVCLLATTGAVTASAAPSASTNTRPNIVVLYLDDVSPHDGRLWNDPARTPTIYDRFIAHGTEFSTAVGETPLCCPGRANFLTGLHTHNNGVLHNQAREFNPAEHIGRELKSAGYASMWIGKYFNSNQLLTEADWTAHGRGWTYLDVIYGGNGDYLDYRVRTKTGMVAYPTLHSTLMVGERAVQRFRATPATVPIFAVLSVYDLHAPNTAVAQFRDDPRCAGFPPWNPPNYNEADVSDKPAYIQSLPLLPYANGWPMRDYCEEMLGVDLMIDQVIDELTASGRINNTLLVFTADNGMTWGAHRMGEQKLIAYATPVPMYMSWPARWGAAPRTIDEVVSTIDLAPTFCAIGGCAMDNYPYGRGKPDGRNLLPLLDGDVTGLGRDAVLETAWSGQRTWSALRTSPNHQLGRWHYVEWASGERELYDSQADPWELENLAGQPQVDQVEAALATRLAELRLEHARARPDASLALSTAGPFVGETIVSSTPISAQTLKRTVIGGQTYEYVVRIRNRGGFADAFWVSGSSSGSASMTVRYFVGTTDITAAVVAGTYQTAQLPIVGSTNIKVRVIVGVGAPAGAVRRAVVTVASVKNSARLDVVRAVAEVSP